jgi:methionine-rich copper-binding protein CopC
MTSTLTRRAIAPAALTLALGAAAVAWAEPNRTVEMTAAAPIFEWDSDAITGTPVNDVSVDDTLIKLTEAGELKASISDPDDGAQDIDMELWRADAAGETQGDDPITDSATDGNDEAVSAKNLKPGTYLIRLYGFISFEGHVKGKATFVSAAPAEPAPSGTPAPAPLPAGGGEDATPDAKLGKVAKTVKAKKLKRFKGTASDDKAVAKVEVALVRQKGKQCYVMTSKGGYAKLEKCSDPTIFNDATGTTSWSYALPKRLKKGSYTVYARAIDSAGQTQAGFGPDNRKAFKVK